MRVVSQKVGAWIGKLGWVWVDGQVAQISRRPGNQVVFLTLRDPSADLSLTVTTNRDVLDLGAPNLAEGARVVLHARPEFYPARGTLSLRADEIRQVGLGELLARIETAEEGCWPPRGCSTRAASAGRPSCRAGSGWSPAGPARPSGTC